jgi:hypothetical protein
LLDQTLPRADTTAANVAGWFINTIDRWHHNTVACR